MANYQSKYTGAQIDAGIDAAQKALPKSGGTMTGALFLSGAPTQDMQAASKKYVDDNKAAENVVQYVAQTLTDEQKAQARVNIGAAEEEGEAVYETIETIQLEGDVTVDKNMEPDGTPYNFVDVIVELYTSDASTVTGHLYVHIFDKIKEQAYYGIANAIVANSSRYTAAEAHKRKGIIETSAVDPGMAKISMVAVKRKPITDYADGNIDRIQTWASVPFPAGSYITIKAVRANA